VNAVTIMTDIVVEVSEAGGYSYKENEEVEEPPTKCLKIDECQPIRSDFYNLLGALENGSPESHEFIDTENLFCTEASTADAFGESSQSVYVPADDLTLGGHPISPGTTGSDQDWDYPLPGLSLLSTPTPFGHSSNLWHDGLPVSADPPLVTKLENLEVQMTNQLGQEKPEAPTATELFQDYLQTYLDAIKIPTAAAEPQNANVGACHDLFNNNSSLQTAFGNNRSHPDFEEDSSPVETVNDTTPTPSGVETVANFNKRRREDRAGTKSDDSKMDTAQRNRERQARLADRNRSDRARPGRLRDSSPSGFGQDAGSVTIKRSATKRSYQRVKFYPEWYHWSSGHLLTVTKSDGDRYFKKRLTKHDIKTLSDVVGYTIGLEDESQAPPVQLPRLDGYLPVLSRDGHLSFVPAPQEPFSCPTKEHVYALELQHGFCREYALKESRIYMELHNKNFRRKMPLNCDKGEGEGGNEVALHQAALASNYARLKPPAQVTQAGNTPSGGHEPTGYPTTEQQEQLIRFLKTDDWSEDEDEDEEEDILF